MGTIKDISDLLSKLIGNIKDRKFASELREIQTLVNTLQSENTVLQDKNSALVAENSNLKTENLKLKQTIENYKQEISNQNKPQLESKFKLDNITEQILQQFFKTGRELPSEYFVSTLSLEVSVIKYHFDLLLDNGYIDRASFNTDFITGKSSTIYSISPKGREYIMKNT